MLKVNQVFVMKIGGISIGPGSRLFVIPQLSGNHKGSLDPALALVDAAATAVAHCLRRCHTPWEWHELISSSSSSMKGKLRRDVGFGVGSRSSILASPKWGKNFIQMTEQPIF